MKTKYKYFGMLVREDNRWSYEFGSTDKSDILFEIQDYKDKGYKTRDLQLLSHKTIPTQYDIDLLVQTVNNIQSSL